tara:strand:+ start:2487 stop:2699 length:213 start_codon:yes stop_codon:yes gene_type:complete
MAEMPTPQEPYIWHECECCEDFLCSIHSVHAHDCACPGIDQWAETEWNPYLDVLNPAIEKWVGENPYAYT